MGVSAPVFCEVRVVNGQVGMIVRDLVGVEGGPEPHGGDKGQRTDRAEKQSGVRQAK